MQGTVSAAYARGFIVDDTTGAILVYLNAPSNYSLGDVVKVKGAVTEYNSGMQFGNTAEITLVEKTKNFASFCLKRNRIHGFLILERFRQVFHNYIHGLLLLISTKIVIQTVDF